MRLEPFALRCRRRLRPWSLCLLLGAGLLLPAVLAAQPTAFDPSFSGNGELENPFPTLPAPIGDRRFRALALDHEERIYLAGSGVTNFPPGAQRALYLGRLLGNGQADASYASGGVDESAYSSELHARDLLVRPDGSALLCAAAYQQAPADATTRVLSYLPNGQPDPDFAVDGGIPGILILDGVLCESIDSLSDGRIVMAASVAEGNSTRPAVLVFDAQGRPDPAFAGTGRQLISGALGATRGVAAVEQPGLGLLVAVAQEPPADETGRAVVLRLSLAGSLDESFQPLVLPFDDFPSVHIERIQNGGQMLTVLPDNGIQVALAKKFSVRASVDRYGADGGDPPLVNDRFGASSGNNDDAYLAAHALGPDGRPLLASLLRRDPDACPRTDRFHHLTRRLRNGGGDGSFAAQGQAFWYPVQPLFDFSDCSEGVLDVHDVALQRDGRILLLSSIQQARELPLVTRLQGNAFAAAAWDLQPAPMSFPSVTARPNALVRSDVTIVSGLGAGIHVPAYVLGEGAELSVNYGPYRRAPAMVGNGDVLRLRMRASAQSGASAVARLFVGGLRGNNGWAALGPRVQAEFFVSSSQPTLPGIACSSSALNGNCNAAIPDQGSIDSTINFINDGSCPFVGGVRVGVDLSHSYVGDLRLTLTDPNGQVFVGGSEGIVSLLNRPRAAGSTQSGSCTLDDLLATFDDEALAAAQGACGNPLAQPALSGELQPNTPLSELFGRRTTGNNGAASSGLWTLRVEDQAAGDVGQLNDWSLDIQCLSQPPALSDLSVDVSAPGVVVAGTTVNLNWTVTNLGPSPTSNGRFRASLPSALNDALDNPAWGCSSSAGGSCTPAIGCFGACLGSEIDIGFGLPVGGTMTVFATGTLTQLGSGNLSVGARVSTPLAVGGSRDNNPDNDQLQYLASIQRQTDLAVSALSHSWAGQMLEVRVVVGNAGPSQADGFSGSIDLPDGLTVVDTRCERAQLSCTGNLALTAGNVLNFNQVGLFANATPHTYIVQAQWSGSNSPGSVQIQLQPDGAASDPQPGNNQASQLISAPPPSNPLIFADGFE